MSHNNHFDYIIVGNGLAGLQLALKMASESFFNKKQILLIDASKKIENDKTWSFWEQQNTLCDKITHHKWHKAQVITQDKLIPLDLKPYQYKTIKAIDFYNCAKAELKQHKNIFFVLDEVISVEKIEAVTVKAKRNTYKAHHVFDSRIPKAFIKHKQNYVTLIQHFKGYVIETETACFDDTKITMMDYRLKDGNQTTFTYVLPFSKTKALVEFTYFTEKIVDESVYDNYIKQYIANYLKIDKYSVLETEMGQIPMTNFPFEKFNTEYITKIGTGGGWVKGSTGYSFKHTEKKVAKIVQNIKAHKSPSNKLFKKRYKFYDAVFLQVLKKENSKGEWLFKQFYSKNNVETMFRFLDEDSTILEDLKIMYALFSWCFIKAFFKTLQIKKL